MHNACYDQVDSHRREPMEFAISDHLIVPYGVERWKIEDIRITAVSTSKTFFKTDIPVIHIEKGKAQPLRIGDCFLNFIEHLPENIDVEENASSFFTHLKSFCDNRTPYEKLFLEAYHQYLVNEIFHPEHDHLARLPPANNPYWFYAALFPIPQAHLYVVDPLRDKIQFVPEHMHKVDFAFWTGSNFVAVEIDGSSHVGSERHILKDRRLQRAGVQVIHILNGEVTEFGTDVIKKLMPPIISEFWCGVSEDRLSFIQPW